MSKPASPQMPDVIYAYPLPRGIESAGNWHLTKELGTSYTRTDLCEELKKTLNDLIQISKCIPEFDSILDNYPKQFYKTFKKKITKAQALLQ